MAGYGNADDHIGATENHINDSIQLARLQQAPADNYDGVCRDCGEEIDSKRLKAMPHCRLCRHCKEEEEKSQKGKARHICRNTYVP
jgi:RNA polymerase-binding transcription factor DksA